MLNAEQYLLINDSLDYICLLRSEQDLLTAGSSECKCFEKDLLIYNSLEHNYLPSSEQHLLIKSSLEHEHLPNSEQESFD